MANYQPNFNQFQNVIIFEMALLQNGIIRWFFNGLGPAMGKLQLKIKRKYDENQRY